MNHALRKFAVPLAGVAALSLSLAACHPSSSSSSGNTASAVESALRSNPALHQQLTGTEAKEIKHLKSCLPPGSASAVDAVMAGQASVETAFQLGQAFQGTSLQQVEAKCIPGGGSHPVHLFDACFKGHAPDAIKSAIAAAVKPYETHPVKNRHVIAGAGSVATSQTAVRVAAGCLNKLSK